jgi:hypothetical protein
VTSVNFTQQYRTLYDMENNLFGAYDVTHNRSNYLRQMIDQQFNLNRPTWCLVQPYHTSPPLGAIDSN